jgi:thiaminase
MATHNGGHRLAKSKSDTRMKETIKIPSFEELYAEAKGKKSVAFYLRDGYQYVEHFAAGWGIDAKKASRHCDTLTRAKVMRCVQAYSLGRLRKLYKLA